MTINESELTLISDQRERKLIQNCLRKSKQFFKRFIGVSLKGNKGSNLKRRVSLPLIDFHSGSGQDDTGDNIDNESMTSSKYEKKRNISTEIEILDLKRKLKSRDQEIMELEKFIATLNADNVEVLELKLKLKVRDEEIMNLENIIGNNETITHARAEILDLKSKLKSKYEDISHLEDSIYKSNKIITDLQNKLKKLGRFYFRYNN